MTPSLQGLKMVCTFFLLQTMHSVCFGNLKKLERIFGYDFSTEPTVNTVLIWKISEDHKPFSPLQYTWEGVQFSSEETYILFAPKGSAAHTVHYWLGENTSLNDKQVVARYAVLLSEYNLRYTSIGRETNGMESDLFQHKIKMFFEYAESHNPYDFYTSYLFDCFPLPRPNLYVLRRDGHSQIKKIPLSLGLQWMINGDTCIVLELENKETNMMSINYLCGPQANNDLVEVAESFTDYFYGQYIKEYITDSVYNNRNSNDFKQFFEILEDSSLYNPYDIDDSGDHLKNATEFIISRDEEISLFDVTNSGLQRNQIRPESSFFQIHSMGYLIDTKSVAGVFLIFVASTDIDERVTAVELAEEYMEKTYPLSSGKTVKMRIVDTSLDYSAIVDLIIHLSDYVFSMEKDLVEEEVGEDEELEEEDENPLE